jgi:L-alanine-DL-glutamate epimerase-like enolase superfamily enzyme
MMVHINCAWLAHEAETHVRATKSFDPLWIEEPLWPPENLTFGPLKWGRLIR